MYLYIKDKKDETQTLQNLSSNDESRRMKAVQKSKGRLTKY